MRTLFIFFAYFFCSCTNNVKKTKVRLTPTKYTTIYIQPFIGFPATAITLLSKEPKAFYKVNVVFLKPMKIMESARLGTSMRFSADKILQLLKQKSIHSSDKILGLTSYDIYTPKKVNGTMNPYWGIFGLGQHPGISCVVSDNRLVEFGGKTIEFVTNVTLHEIGHTPGLDHCDKDARCLMNDAKGKGATLFNEGKWICPNCVRLLHKSNSYFPLKK